MKENLPKVGNQDRLALFDAIWIVGHLSPNGVSQVALSLERKALDVASSEAGGIVKMVVKSDGGETRELRSLLNHMNRIRETYGIKFETIADQYANSAATVLIAAGDKGHRIALSPETEFLVHKTIVSSRPAEADEDEIKQELYEDKVETRKMFKYLSVLTGKSLKEIYEQVGPLTAHQALEWKIIDKIMLFDSHERTGTQTS